MPPLLCPGALRAFVIAAAACACACACLASADDDRGGLTAVEYEEWEALARLKNATGGPDTDRGATFGAAWDAVTPQRVCGSGNWTDAGGASWVGVECSGGRVVQLGLVLGGLAGTLPSNWGGLDRLLLLYLEKNEISGTLPIGTWRFPNLLSLGLGDNALSGPLPRNLSGLPRLASLSVARNKLDGRLPGLFVGANRLYDLQLQGNRISGDVPPLNLPGLGNLDVSRNALDGSVLLGGDAKPLLYRLDLSHNSELKGALPRGLLCGAALTEVDLSRCGLSSIADAVDCGAGSAPSRPALASLRVAHNRVEGTVPATLCSMPRLASVNMAGNRMSGPVPACFSRMPSLRSLDFGGNAVTGFEDGFFSPQAPSPLRAISLRGSAVTGAGFLAALPNGTAQSPFLQMAELDLSGSVGMNLPAGVLLARVLSAFPALGVLGAANCTLSSEIIGSVGGLISLDVSDNAEFVGFVPTSGGDGAGDGSNDYVNLQRLSVAGTAFLSQPAVALSLRYFDRSRMGHAAQATDCLDDSLLLDAALLQTLDIREPKSSVTRQITTPRTSGGGARVSACHERTRARLRPDPGGAVTVFQLKDSAATLTCPKWRMLSSGGELLADADFLRYEQCRCADGLVWRWTNYAEGTGRCEPSAPNCSEMGGSVRCDPYVVSQAHCVTGGVYPVVPRDGFGDAADLPFASTRILACRRAGVCNVGSDGCDRRVFRNEPHSDVTRRARRLDFACASGHDADSLLCSRCEASHWPSGTACLECRESFVWLVPVASAAALAAAAALVWRRAGRSPDGARTLATALFWLQLTAILEASSQLSAGNASTSTWSWLASVRSWLESWAVIEPWAAQCVFGRGFDFVASSVAVLCAPLVVACATGVAYLCLRSPALRARLVHAGCFALFSLLLPVCTRALQLFNCESQAGVSYLSAAPYVLCEDDDAGGLRRPPELGRARVLAALTLALYVAPLVLLSVRVVWLGRPAAVARDVGGSSLGEKLIARPGDAAQALGGGGTGTFRLASVAESLFFAPLRSHAQLWWWPVAHILVRGLALAMLVGLADADSALLTVGVFALLSASAILHAHFRPWRMALDNALESFVLLAALATYLLNIIGSREASSLRAGADGSAVVDSQRAVRAVLSLIHLFVLGVLGVSLWISRGAGEAAVRGESPASGDSASVDPVYGIGAEPHRELAPLSAPLSVQ